MHTTDIIRLSLDKTFSVYKNAIKGLFNFSFIFSVVWGLIIIAVTVPILLVLYYLGIGHEFENNLLRSWFAEDTIYNIRLLQYTQAGVIMTLPIFGIYILQKNPEEKYSLRNTFTGINQSLWVIWFSLLFGIFFIYTITFACSSSSDYLSVFGLTDFTHDWPYLMFELIKAYLPYFAAIIFTMQYYKGKEGIQKNVVYASSIMTFIIITLADTVLAYYDIYIASFFRMIPFLDTVFPLLIGWTLQLTINSYILPGMAIAFTYPVKITKEGPPESTPFKEDHTPIL